MEQLNKRKEIASEILGEIDWVNGSTGCCRCPGIQHHTGKNHRQDCRVYLDDVPTVDCFHESCQDEIREANRTLRSLIGKAEVSLNPQKRIPHAAINPEKEELLRKAEYLRRRLQADYGWSYSEIRTSSNPPDHPTHQRIALFHLFDVLDRVWNDHLVESGKPFYASRFKTIEEWMNLCWREDPSPGKPVEFSGVFREFTAPSSFKPGSFVRGKESLHKPRFLVVESDTLSKDHVGAVFKWLESHIRLRTIIDTGGKSLHGWFDYPEKELLEELKVILPVLGCDRKMFNPTQPCRMPGVIRSNTGTLQEMIYLKGGLQ